MTPEQMAKELGRPAMRELKAQLELVWEKFVETHIKHLGVIPQHEITVERTGHNQWKIVITPKGRI